MKLLLAVLITVLLSGPAHASSFFGVGSFIGGFFSGLGSGGGAAEPSLDFSIDTNSMYIPLF